MTDAGHQSSPVLEAAHAFAQARGHPAAIFFLAQDEPIGTPNVRALGKLVGDRTFDQLDLVIHSSGGDIHAAYQLVSFLRRRSEKLFACVPRYARSAATLLCVGADEIVLDDLAALGPLDAQIYEGIDNGRADYKSALNQFKGLERLRDFSLDTLFNAAATLYDKRVIESTDMVLKHGIEFVRVTTTPLLEKIQSHRLGDYGQALAIGEEYGRRLLRRLHDVSEERRDEIVQQLVHGYPSHEYVIDYQELHDLGLPVRLFEGEERAAARALAERDSRRTIAVVDPNATVEVQAAPGSEASADGAARPPAGVVEAEQPAETRVQSQPRLPGGRSSRSDNPWRR